MRIPNEFIKLKDTVDEYSEYLKKYENSWCGVSVDSITNSNSPLPKWVLSLEFGGSMSGSTPITTSGYSSFSRACESLIELIEDYIREYDERYMQYQDELYNEKYKLEDENV